jgi:hypothetical protein
LLPGIYTWIGSQGNALTARLPGDKRFREITGPMRQFLEPSATHGVEVGDVGKRPRDLVVGVHEAVGGMHLADAAMRHLPAPPRQVFDDVAALVTVDEFVEIDLET